MPLGSSSIGLELRSAFRSLRRSPVVSLVAIGVLGVGIAGATIVYSIANAVLFRGMPYSDPETLCLVTMDYSFGELLSIDPNVLHWELFEQLRDDPRPRSRRAVAAYAPREANLGGDGWK